MLQDKVRQIATDLLDRLRNTQSNRESRLIDEATFGAECATMLENPAFREFLARSEARLTDELLKAPVDDHEMRYRLAIAVKTQRAWADFLIKSAQAGRIAEAELEKIRRGRERVFR